MKIEKDNAMDRADQCEQAAKAAKVKKKGFKKRPVFVVLSPLLGPYFSHFKLIHA